MNKKTKWTIEDLKNLLGQAESSRLEFKSSRLLSKNKDEYIRDLTREISAFANSEGGIIIIGIEEDKKIKPPVALSLSDGVNKSDFPLDTFQKTIESNFSPYLPNMHFYEVFLNKSNNKIAIIIDVPQGNTAYQAKDRLYYGRSEFEVKSLPDHEIRLRMLKKQISSASFIIEKDFDSLNYKFKTFIRNTGYRTINDFLLKLEFKSSSNFNFKDELTSKYIDGNPHYFHFNDPDDISIKPNKLYPDQLIEFPFSVSWIVGYPPHINKYFDSSLQCKWTLYLDDSPSIEGDVDIFSLISNYR